MKIKYLFQALRFACLPTLSILVLLFFGFFSIDKTISFISSNDGWAIFLRVLLVIAEITLIIYMYIDYKNKGEYEDLINQKSETINNCLVNNSRSISSYTEAKGLKGDWHKNDGFKVYETEIKNIVLVERILKNE